MITLIENAFNHLDRIAISDNNQNYTYRQLLDASQKIAITLLEDKKDLNEARIAFIVAPSFEYACIQWGIWRAGGIAVPLCVKYPCDAIKYVIEDVQAEAVVFSYGYRALIEPLFQDFELRRISIEAVMLSVEKEKLRLPQISLDRRGMIIYTSGTTGRPKGVVSTHKNIEAQIKSLVTSWEWTKEDHILNILPLHHVHGIINVLSCALWSGACCEFLEKFEAKKVFDVFCRQEVDLFMAVPTIYYRLIHYWKELTAADQQKITASFKDFRLMVSGSAALPISTLDEWEKISGHTLLERYGMTEMGMAISNPYRGNRKPGHIGVALAGVTIRIADENNHTVVDGISGEIQVKGPNVFKEYWGKPYETEGSFIDGWFKTGDIAVFEKGSYKILGRNSVDIIKSGGYKISALEIEEVLRRHPAIEDCAVVGIPDEEWGEIIGASLIMTRDQENTTAIKEWLKDRLSGYKIPRKYLIQTDLPRNVMGKVTKKVLQKIFIEDANK
ncbi:MAG: long-chain fatty acid--CoA ligase [Flammeovirgaceae bacterium]|nr:long-chain fatty acid--CoA ligase [Flammeovirgaceae bacterium]